MLHNSAAEHHDKLRKVLGRIEAEVHKDDLDDFFKTAYHLIEITEKDPATTLAQKAAALVLSADGDMKICREVCLRQKHFTLRPKHHRSPKTADATTKQGWDVGRYGKSGFGIGEQSVTINLTDGTTRDALDLVRGIAAKWAAVF